MNDDRRKDLAFVLARSGIPFNDTLAAAIDMLIEARILKALKSMFNERAFIGSAVEGMQAAPTIEVPKYRLNNDLRDFVAGLEVWYVPYNIQGEWKKRINFPEAWMGWPDIEAGRVTRVSAHGVFVNFPPRECAESCNPDQLVTKIQGT